MPIPQQLLQTLDPNKGLSGEQSFTQETSDPVASQEAAYRDVQNFIASVQQMNTQGAENKNIIEQARISTIKKAIELLQAAGVNPADPASLQGYLAELEQQSPDLAEMARNALDMIFSDQESQEPQEPQEPQPMT